MALQQKIIVPLAWSDLRMNILWITHIIVYLFYALSFYVTKTVLVGPKWFWSDRIDLVSTKMKWSRPEWIGQVQIVIFYQNVSHLDLTN